MQASQAPAVVVGAGTCGLGLVRSLGRGNVPIIVVDTSPIEPAMHSRFGRPVVVSALSGRPLVDELTALAKFLKGPAVLFLTSDEMVLTVSEFRTTLEKTYRFSLPDHKSLIALMSKGDFQKFAEANGFPVPLSLTIGQAAKFEALSKLTFPCIVKPAIKNEAYVSHQFQRAYKVTTEADAEAVCRLLLSVVPSVVVQEWVEGPDSEIFFCLQYRSADGRTISSFTGRKLSIWPPDVGVTVSCTAALEAQPILQPLTEAFFDAASFIGLGSMEFKRDVRTGKFLMIEPTVGRADLQEEISTLCGINIPLAMYCHETCLPALATKEIAKAAIWRGSWNHRRSGNQPRGTFTAKSAFSPRYYDAYWRFYDPLPAVIHAAQLTRSIAADLIRRLRMIWIKRVK